MTTPAARRLLVDRLFSHRSIAVVGASERPDSRGRQIIENLMQADYRGQIFPVHPKYGTVMGLPAHPDLESLPEVPDVAALCISADATLEAVSECARLGITAVAAIASGFNESGTADGRRRHEKLSSLCSDNGIVLLGPNGLGLNNRRGRVHYWQPGIGGAEAPASGVSMILQSGALTETATRLAAFRGLDLDYVVSTGNELSVTAEDYLDYVLDQDATRVVGLLREGIREPERFLELAREARRRRVGIVALMVGRHPAGREITASHTASLLGSDNVIESVFAANGIVNAKNMDDWINTILLMAQRDRPRGRAVGVVSMSGGGSGMLADLAADIGLELPPMPAPTRQAMQALHAHRPVTNPLDAGGYYGHPDAFPTAVNSLFTDPGIDVVVGCANSYTDEPSRFLLIDQLLEAAAGDTPKAVALCTYGSETPPPELVERCRAVGVYPLTGAQSALRAIASWIDLDGNGEADSDRRDGPVGDKETHDRVPAAAGLTTDAVAALQEFGVPFPPHVILTPDPRPTDLALRFPVVLKAEHPDLPHKTEAGAVRLGTGSLEELHVARDEMAKKLASRDLTGEPTYVVYEEAPAGTDLILGIKRDPVFGPVVLIGMGGVLVELFDDWVVSLPPITHSGALELIRKLKGFRLLDGYRGAPPSDIPALCEVVQRFGELAMRLPDDVLSLEVNPLRVLRDGDGVVALDVLCDYSGKRDM